MSKTIVMDTREQKGKHDHVTKRFEELGYKIVRSKLLCGDYTYLQNMSICVDTKKIYRKFAEMFANNIIDLLEKYNEAWKMKLS